MPRTPKVRMAPVAPVNVPEMPVVTPKPKAKFSPVVVVLTGLLLIAVSAAGYFYWQYRHTGPAADAAEIAALEKKIGEVMILPEGETPTLATVTDKSKLADQPFFQKAENGDKVLIYSNHGRAILYRPSTKKIVDVTAVNITPPVGSTTPVDANQSVGESPATPTDQTKVIKPNEAVALNVRVAIYNGSGENGAGANLEKQIRDLYPGATFPKTTDAATDHEQSVVVDLTGSNAVIGQAFANLVHGSIGKLPEGEKDPGNADLLVIIGKAR